MSCLFLFGGMSEPVEYFMLEWYTIMYIIGYIHTHRERMYIIGYIHTHRERERERERDEI